MLIEAYIDMRYFERAIEMLDKLKDIEKSSVLDIFRGDIEFARGNIEAAKFIWNSIDKADQSNQYEVGERFNRMCEYDKAIECFENSFAAATIPRILSSTYSLAFLYTKLGKYQNAIDMWQRILDVQAKLNYDALYNSIFVVKC